MNTKLLRNNKPYLKLTCAGFSSSFKIISQTFPIPIRPALLAKQNQNTNQSYWFSIAAKRKSTQPKQQSHVRSGLFHLFHPFSVHHPSHVVLRFVPGSKVTKLVKSRLIFHPEPDRTLLPLRHFRITSGSLPPNPKTCSPTECTNLRFASDRFPPLTGWRLFGRCCGSLSFGFGHQRTPCASLICSFFWIRFQTVSHMVRLSFGHESKSDAGLHTDGQTPGHPATSSKLFYWE